MEEQYNEDEIEDMKEDMMEDDKELQQELTDEEKEAYGVPEPEQTFERFKFLTEVRDRDDTLRTSYLTKGELGMPLFSVRFWENLKLIADLKDKQILAGFLHNKALATTHTGLSREGFLLNTAITKRKEQQKSRTKSKQEVENEPRKNK